MLQAILDYYDKKDYPNSWDSEKKREEVISAKTEIEIFEQFYRMNNRLRYCNGAYYKFNTKEWDEGYKNWLNSDDYNKKSFELYYGNGVVD